VHIEFLVEDSSGRTLLEPLIPKILGEYEHPHTWRLHAYRGVGKIPPKLSAAGSPSARILLDQLPRLLNGYGRTTGIDAVVVVLDSDRRDCKTLLSELHQLRAQCAHAPQCTLFRLAIEEMEAWYFGDRTALLEAFPSAKQEVLKRYQQDKICGTWELLADAIYPGGVKAIKEVGWPLPGQVKHEWAERIGPLLEPERNVSPSFQKLRSGLQRLVAAHAASTS
jgi:Domain of unknown function (DUF4276)